MKNDDLNKSQIQRASQHLIKNRSSVTNNTFNILQTSGHQPLTEESLQKIEENQEGEDYNRLKSFAEYQTREQSFAANNSDTDEDEDEDED